MWVFSTADQNEKQALVGSFGACATIIQSPGVNPVFGSQSKVRPIPSSPLEFPLSDGHKLLGGLPNGPGRE